MLELDKTTVRSHCELDRLLGWVQTVSGSLSDV